MYSKSKWSFNIYSLTGEKISHLKSVYIYIFTLIKGLNSRDNIILLCDLVNELNFGCYANFFVYANVRFCDVCAFLCVWLCVSFSLHVCCDITAVFLPSDVQICHKPKIVMDTLFICLKPMTQCIFLCSVILKKFFIKTKHKNHELEYF